MVYNPSTHVMSIQTLVISVVTENNYLVTARM